MTNNTVNAPRLELWDIERVLPHPRNAKKHDANQVNKLAASLKKLGWTSPIVVDKDGYVIAGHGRRLAAIQLAMPKVPVLVRDDLTTEEADALRLADNRIAMDGEIDTEMLNAELKRLSDSLVNFDMSVLGYDVHELTFLTANLTEIDPSAFTNDIMNDAALNPRQAKADAEAADAERVPLSRLFGFKDVSLQQSRKLKGLLLLIEGETGKDGLDALLTYAEQRGV